MCLGNSATVSFLLHCSESRSQQGRSIGSPNPPSLRGMFEPPKNFPSLQASGKGAQALVMLSSLGHRTSRTDASTRTRGVPFLPVLVGMFPPPTHNGINITSSRPCRNTPSARPLNRDCVSFSPPSLRSLRTSRFSCEKPKKFTFYFSTITASNHRFTHQTRVSHIVCYHQKPNSKTRERRKEKQEQTRTNSTQKNIAPHCHHEKIRGNHE